MGVDDRERRLAQTPKSRVVGRAAWGPAIQLLPVLARGRVVAVLPALSSTLELCDGVDASHRTQLDAVVNRVGVRPMHEVVA